MLIKQNSDGNWYVCRRASSNRRGKTGKCSRDSARTFRNWWLVKYVGGSGYILSPTSAITCPKSFIGKKVRLKVEVIE